MTRRATTVTVTLPWELIAAIDAEAHRRLIRRGEVLAGFLREAWPAYVAERLADDLGPVVDADVVDDLANAATPPDEPAAHHDEPSTNAVASLPPARPDGEASRAEPPG